jgi:hypothetical protein
VAEERQAPGPAAAHAAPRRPGDAYRLLRAAGRFLVDWFPLLIVLFAYDEIHNRFGRLLPSPHTFPQIRADEMLFGTPVPTVRMQQAFYSPDHPRGWDFATLVVYMSHFFVSVLIGLALWVRARPRYLRFMVWFVILTTMGYITYGLFPAVPPWLASQHGDLAPTHRMVRELWDQLGLHGIASGFSGSNLVANDVAAVPSLHAAYPVMIAVFFWPSARPPVRITLALYVVAMAVALVYSAEHYVFDILLGWLYAAAAALIMQRIWPVTRPRLG